MSKQTESSKLLLHVNISTTGIRRALFKWNTLTEINYHDTWNTCHKKGNFFKKGENIYDILL